MQEIFLERNKRVCKEWCFHTTVKNYRGDLTVK